MKQELLNFLKENGDVEQAGTNEIANKTKNPIEAINIINQYKEIIIKSNNNWVGQILQKIWKVENFIQNVGQSKSTFYYKIRMYKFLKNYSALKNSILPSSYFKNNFKAIKVVCWNHGNVFL